MIGVQLTDPAVFPVLFSHNKSRLPALKPRPQFDPAKHLGNGQRIFVIDDEALVADSLVEILNARGYQAQAFYEGPAAIDAVRKECPDFVLADVIMPSLSGVDTVLAIRRICPRTRILLFSGQATTADVMEITRARGHQFELLPKPIHPDKLLKRLALLGKTS